MALAGNCIITLWTGVRPELREDFMEWHPREHIGERLAVDGFLRGSRYIALEGAPEFFILFELRQPEVLFTEEYRTRLTNPTPWSRAILPALTDNTRGACRIEYTGGCAMGGCMLTLRLAAQAGREAGLMEALRSQVLPPLCERQRITGAHLLRNDEALTAGNSGQQRGRMIHQPELVLLLEGSDARAVSEAGASFLGDAALQALGAQPGVQRGLYQMEYSVQNLAR